MRRLRDLLRPNYQPLIAPVTEYAAEARAAGRTLILLTLTDRMLVRPPLFHCPPFLHALVIERVEAVGWRMTGIGRSPREAYVTFRRK